MVNIVENREKKTTTVFQDVLSTISNNKNNIDLISRYKYVKKGGINF